jgi:hypothetical protein
MTIRSVRLPDSPPRTDTDRLAKGQRQTTEKAKGPALTGPPSDWQPAGSPNFKPRLPWREHPITSKHRKAEQKRLEKLGLLPSRPPDKERAETQDYGRHAVDLTIGEAFDFAQSKQPVYDETDLVKALDEAVAEAENHAWTPPLGEAERAELQAELHEVEMALHVESHLRRLALGAADPDDRAALRRSLKDADLEALLQSIGVTDAEWEAIAMTANGSIRDVGELLHISHVAVQRRVNRARSKVAEYLEGAPK